MAVQPRPERCLLIFMHEIGGGYSTHRATCEQDMIVFSSSTVCVFPAYLYGRSRDITKGLLNTLNSSNMAGSWRNKPLKRMATIQEAE